MRRLPPPVTHLFGTQHGVAGRDQLVDFLTAKSVDGLVRHGSLAKVERGVYRSAIAPVTRPMEAMAAQIRSRPDARLTGAFVLGLLDIDGFSPADAFTVLTAPGRRLQGVTFRHRPDPVPDRRPVMIGPLACLHPSEAIVDAACDLPSDRSLRVAIDVLRRRGSWVPERVERELAARGPGDPGAAALARVFGDGSLASETEPERDLGRLVLDVAPDAEPQVWITAMRRVDWFIRRLRLAFEYLGGVDHDHDDGRLEDAARTAEAAEVGVRIIPVVKRDLADEPACRRWIAAVVAAREFELARHS